MTSGELKDKRTQLTVKLEGLFNERNERALTEDENKELRGLLADAKNLDDQIDLENQVEAEKLKNEKRTAVEITSVDKNKNNENNKMEDNFIKRAIESAGKEVRLITSAKTTQAAHADEKSKAVKELIPQTTLHTMGADITHTSANITIPVYGKVTESNVDFVDEGYEVGEMALGVTSIPMTPKRIGVTVPIPAIVEEQEEIGMVEYIKERALKLLATKLDKKVLSDRAYQEGDLTSGGVFAGIETEDLLGAELDRDKLIKVSGDMFDNGSLINDLSVFGSGAIESKFLIQDTTKAGNGVRLLGNDGRLDARGMKFIRSVHTKPADKVIIGDMSMIRVNFFLNNTKVIRELNAKKDLIEYTFTFYVDWCNTQKEAFKALDNVKID